MQPVRRRTDEIWNQANAICKYSMAALATVDVEEEILLSITFGVFGVSWNVKIALIKEKVDEDNVIKGVT